MTNSVHVPVSNVKHHIELYIAGNKEEYEAYALAYAEWSNRFYNAMRYLTKRKYRNPKWYREYGSVVWDLKFKEMFATSKPKKPDCVHYYPALVRLGRLCQASPSGTLVLDEEAASAVTKAREYYNG